MVGEEISAVHSFIGLGLGITHLTFLSLLRRLRHALQFRLFLRQQQPAFRTSPTPVIADHWRSHAFSIPQSPFLPDMFSRFFFKAICNIATQYW